MVKNQSLSATGIFQKSLLSQMVWIFNILAVCFIAFSWGGDFWQLIFSNFSSEYIDRESFFLKAFGCLCLFFYPAAILMIAQAVSRRIRVNGESFERIYILLVIAFCISAAKTGSAYL
ncbi:hypothetical protein FRC97_00185 (plasmid) [Paracidovorax citrulli]|uniref:hypothetical protein n=1 Tax=Paracidovorax citrulli TaxID=80869 RepID=UPI000AA1213B|nr:hypothetical protein [Paracidovorax citrulli]UMT93555.1 hypothetical protein FRC97_00185 [Paracidovorax citrulli]